MFNYPWRCIKCFSLYFTSSYQENTTLKSIFIKLNLKRTKLMNLLHLSLDERGKIYQNVQRKTFRAHQSQSAVTEWKTSWNSSREVKDISLQELRVLSSFRYLFFISFRSNSSNCRIYCTKIAQKCRIWRKCFMNSKRVSCYFLLSWQSAFIFVLCSVHNENNSHGICHVKQ